MRGLVLVRSRYRPVNEPSAVEPREEEPGRAAYGEPARRYPTPGQSAKRLPVMRSYAST